MKKIKWLIFMCACLVSIYSAFAEDSATNIKKHRNWYSMLYTSKTRMVGRMASSPALNKDVFTIDFIPDNSTKLNNWELSISNKKDSQHQGWISMETPLKTSCALRVDNKSIYSTDCLYLDDENYYYLAINAAYTPRKFLEECLEGNTLRVKFTVNNKDFFERYSLSGFTSAFNRATNLINANNDSSYFNDPKKSSVKSDASYFEI